MSSRFLKATPSYYEMKLLLAVNRHSGLSVPINPHDLPPSTLESVPLSRLLDDGLATLASGESGTILQLTAKGVSHLRGMLIDYHLELMELRAGTDDLFNELVVMLTEAGCSRIVLYGASDTARVLLDYVKDSAISVAGIIDDDVAKQGSLFAGVPVLAPKELEHMECDTVVVTTVMFQEGIMQERARIVPPAIKLIGLFDNLLNSRSGA
jgi:hypothetical protein